MSDPNHNDQEHTPTPSPREVPIKARQLRNGDWFISDAPTDQDDNGRPVKRHVSSIEIMRYHVHVNGNACYDSEAYVKLVSPPVRKPSKK